MGFLGLTPRSHAPEENMEISKGTNLTGKGFFSLPSELRNAIYEDVLEDMEDNNLCVHLGGGPNEKSAPEGPSPLSMLLTCKQISNEATQMAFSKVSLSLTDLWPPIVGNRNDVYAEYRARLESVIWTLGNELRPTTLAQITSMEFPNSRSLLELPTSVTEHFSRSRPSESCTPKCDQLSHHRGPIHRAFHNIRRITISVDNYQEYSYRMLREGASWVSPLMLEPMAESVFDVFSNLEEIVVRRKCGVQTSVVVDGKIFAKDSGLPMRGMEDWRPGFDEEL